MNIKFDDKNIQKNVYFSSAISITAYCYPDDSTLAVLNNEMQQIQIYSLVDSKLSKTIKLPSTALDFDYYAEKFYIMDYNKVYVVDLFGNTISETAFTRPSKPFALEKFIVDNGRCIINIADGTAWEVTESGLYEIDNYYWYYPNNFKGRTEKIDFKSFVLSVATPENKIIKNNIQISDLGLSDDLATVRIMSIENDKLSLDIETSTNNENDLPKRFLVFTNLNGKLISKTEIPFVYSTYISRQFIEYKNSVTYLLSAPDGLYFYELNNSKSSINLPELCPDKYHFNDFLLPNEEIENIDNKDYDNSKAGSNCVTRTQVIENAIKFRDLTWTATSSNIASSCTWLGSGSCAGYVKTPTWVTTGAKTSVPYKWGGHTDWYDYVSLASQGKKTGNYACRAPNGNNGVCPDYAHQCNDNNDVIGVDCSGFISRVWETSNNTTNSLPGISTSLGSATVSSNFSQLQPGDIINYSGHHVRLCTSQNPSGTGSFIESCAGDWRVVDHSYSPGDLSGYTCYKFNNINDARLRLNQAITYTPSTVTQGQPLTITYQIKNFGAETWSGSVGLYIIKSDGTEALIQENTGVTLTSNQASSTFSFTSPSVTSPTGLTKIEVRVKNSSTCNYQRYYKVGAGSYTNPIEFTIYPASGCSAPTTSLSSPANYQAYTQGQTINFAWSGNGGSCSITEYIFYLESPTGSNSSTSVGTNTSASISSSSSSTMTIGTWKWGVKAKNSEGTWGSYTYRYFTISAPSSNYTISTSSNPTAGGTTSGGGTFANGSSCTVTATANSGYTFTNWTENGTQVSTSASYTFTVSGNRTLVANFTTTGGSCTTCPAYDFQDTPSTTWKTSSQSIGSNGCFMFRFPVVPGYTYTFKTGCGDGATATFDTYLELIDYNCAGITNNDDGCESNRSTIQWTCNYSATNWVYLKVRGYSSSNYGTFTLAYLRTDPVINYTISTSANPTAGGSTNGGGTFANGSSCTVTATANSGYTFTNWTENGTQVSTSASYTFTVSANRTLVANFTANPVNYTITLSSNPTAGGTTSGAGTYTSGSSRTVTATANSGYTFTNWTENGTVVSSSASYTFTLTGNRTLVANFTQSVYGLVAYYPFNGNANDASGYNNNGTVSGATLTNGITCNANGAYNFGGYNNSNIIQVNNSTTLQFGQEMSISLYVKLNGADGMDGYGGYNAYGNQVIFAKEADWGGFWATANLNASNQFSTGLGSTDMSLPGLSATLDNYSIGTWVHIVYVFSATQAKLYLNGTLKTTINCTTNFNTANTKKLYFGRYSSYWYPLNGALDEIKIYNKALTSSEVTGLYTPATTYTIATSSNPTVGGTTSGGGTFSCGQNVSLTATPATGYTFTKWTENGTQVSTSATYTFTATSNRTLVANFATTNPLIGYYQFNGNANDASGYNNHGTVSGATYTTDYNCNANSALSVNAKTNYMTVPAFNSSNISVSLWYYFSGTNNDWNTLLCRNGGSYHHLLIEPTTNQIGFYNNNFYSSGYALTPNNWYHLVVVKEGTNSKLYVNGVLKQNSDLSFNNSSYPLSIIGNYGSSNSNQGALGKLDEIRVYNKALTQSEVTALYIPPTTYTVTTSSNPTVGGTTSGGGTFSCGQNVSLTATPATGYTFTKWTENGTQVSTNTTYTFTASGNRTLVAVFTSTNPLIAYYPFNGNANDESGNNNNATVSGATLTIGTNCNSNSAYSFNGSSNYIVSDLNVSETNYSVALWFKTTTQSCGIFSVSSNNLGTGGHDRHIYLLNGNIAARLYSDETIYTTGANYADGNWHLIVYQYSNPDTPQKIYVDGIQKAVGTKTYSDFNWQDKIHIGFSNDAQNNYFNGTIDEVRIYNRALTTSEITALYAPPTTYTISTSVTPTASGTASGSGAFSCGQSVTLTATPATGYTFTKWTENGMQVSTSATYTFTATSNRTLVANFTANSYTIAASVTPANSGTLTGAGTYTYGQTVTLTATPATGYTFTKWTENGTQVSTSATYTFTATANRTLVANFTANSYTIAASVTPANSGTLTGAGTYTHGQTVTLTATPATGYTFTKWTENGTQVSTSATYTFTATSNRTLVANFTANSYTIAASVTPANSGTLIGAGTYTYGQTVTLTATSATGYTFTNWTENGTLVSTSAIYTFTATSNRTIVANFTANSYTIAASVTPANSGTLTGAGTYTYGQSVTLTATPATGYTFTKWTENGTQVSTSASYTFTATANRTLVANFEIQSYNISASANPSNGGSVSGDGYYDYGQTANLTASSTTGYDFINWTENGTVVSTSANYTFTVSGNRTLVANFEIQSYNISASANPSNGGSVNGYGNYDYGQTANLSASSSTGYDFTNWTENGTQVSTNPEYSFIVTNERTLVANFTATVSITDNNEANKISIYPNPNTGQFTVEFENNYSGLISVKIYSMTGSIIEEYILNKNEEKLSHKFNFESISSGNYLIEISTLNNVILLKPVMFNKN